MNWRKREIGDLQAEMEEFDRIEAEAKWRKFLDENPPISIPLITEEEWQALNATPEA
ncbi:hypothetical protein UFOVP21_40 [uncultured Caudovirales phage]|uniref:Uncharacterized protein n=1 Tax=uncultured Caudovirales phage TaxID=2100421 RepID=A0A6J5KN84_9CAUD|nr:hypothetical protein UFOVP21_40 [uncultured Caudovirales phage]